MSKPSTSTIDLDLSPSPSPFISIRALYDLAHGRTTLVVAHRLSTAAKCDKIVVLDQGKVVESGSHSELLALGHQGKYASLWASQQRHKESDLDLEGTSGAGLTN